MASVERGVQGINEARVGAWLDANVEGAQGPYSYELIAGGRSNLTFSVTAANGRRYVLRRPPLGHVLASAHDMGREHKIIAALGPTKVPVPPAYGYCADVEVNDATFYVMGFVEGVIVRDLDVGREVWNEEQRLRSSESLIDVLATLHAIEPDDVGLGDLGRKEAYIERQLKRWITQFQNSKTREVPLIEELHRRLSARIPAQRSAGIVHGDYRLDNTMSALDGPVAAVLDWELCTLGDVMADVGMLSITWADNDDPEASARPDAATQLPGFLRRHEAVERYAKVSGRDVSDLPYFEAFQYWRLACIGEGVLNRYVTGAMGDQPDVDIQYMADRVVSGAEKARRALGDWS